MTPTRERARRTSRTHLAHRKLDEAVFAAYGLPANLADEAILEKLLALNLERAGGGQPGGDVDATG